MNAAERDHIQEVGSRLYERAYALADFEARQDARLTGLDRIRSAIAQEAALRATGFSARPFQLPRGAGQGTQEMQTIAEEVLAKAIAYVQERLDG